MDVREMRFEDGSGETAVPLCSVSIPRRVRRATRRSRKGTQELKVPQGRRGGEGEETASFPLFGTLFITCLKYCVSTDCPYAEQARHSDSVREHAVGTTLFASTVTLIADVAARVRR